MDKKQLNGFIDSISDRSNSTISGEDLKLILEMATSDEPLFSEEILPADYKPETKKASVELIERARKILDEVDKVIPSRQTLVVHPVRKETTVFDSKLGGRPYLPKNMDYPRVLSGEFEGEPLYLLTQLNFSMLPNIEGLPNKGILQFYVGCNGDDVFGVDFDDYRNQNGFRIIYHSDIIDDEKLLMSEQEFLDLGIEDSEFIGEYLPFKGEFLLEYAGVQNCPITANDYCFDNAVSSAYNKIYQDNICGVFSYKPNTVSLYNRDPELCDVICEERTISGTRIGGYPYFTQSDPRENDMYSEYNVLLFQLDSCGDGEDEIIWGDCGVGNFFIKHSDLERLDFTDVLYTWDCC